MSIIDNTIIALKVYQLAEVTTPQELKKLTEDATRLVGFLVFAPYGATLKQTASLMDKSESYIMGILNIFMRAELVERIMKDNQPVLYKLKGT